MNNEQKWVYAVKHIPKLGFKKLLPVTFIGLHNDYDDAMEQIKQEVRKRCKYIQMACPDLTISNRLDQKRKSLEQLVEEFGSQKVQETVEWKVRKAILRSTAGITLVRYPIIDNEIEFDKPEEV